jgi:hypothetical protein
MRTETEMKRKTNNRLQHFFCAFHLPTASNVDYRSKPLNEGKSGVFRTVDVGFFFFFFFS